MDQLYERSGALTIANQFGYGVGHILNDICASMWFTYFLVFFHLVLEFDANQAGILLLIGQITDGLATTFVGYFSDHTDSALSKRYGKRKLWHLFGTFSVLISFPFIFSRCLNCENSHKWAQMIYFSSFIVIFQIGWAAVQVSHLSLIPELSSNDHVRSHLTAIRYGFTVFSNIFVYLVTWAVLRIGGECDKQISPKDEGKFHYVVYIGIAVGTLASLAFHISTKEEDNAEQYEQILATNSANHIHFLRESRLYQVALVYMCARMFVNVTQMLVPLYLHRTLLLPARSLAVVPLTMYIGSLSAAAVQRLLPRSVGRKVNFLGGAIAGVGACIGIFFGEGSTYTGYLIYCVALFLGFGGAVMLVTSLTLASDLVGAKTDASAFVYGLMSFTDKLACGIAISIIQKLAMDADQEYYRIVLVVVGCVTGTVGLLAALLLPRFNSQDVADDLGSINQVENSPLLQPRA